MALVCRQMVCVIKFENAMICDSLHANSTASNPFAIGGLPNLELPNLELTTCASLT